MICIGGTFSHSVRADDIESPSFGTLNSVTKGDIGDFLNYQCALQEDGLHCHFEQDLIMVVKGSPLTCEIKHHSFDETYTKKADGLWVHTSGPTGNCGAVDFTRFERDDSSKITPNDKVVFWNYITQTIYTNENGTAFFVSCKKIKESGASQQITYQWPVKSEYMGCVYIKH